MDRGFGSLQVTFGSLGAAAAPADQTLNGGLRHYPYNSTPQVSPRSNSNLPSASSQGSIIQMQAQRANLNLPVGSLAPQEQFQKPKMLPPQNVTFRGINLTAGSLSPILANESLRHLNHQGEVKFTEPRATGGRQLFPDSHVSNSDDGTDDNSMLGENAETIFGPFSLEAVRASAGSLGECRTPFPYPVNPVSSDLHSSEPAEMLSNHLKLLATFRRLEFEKNRLFGRKRKDKTEDTYEFTPETFLQVNTEASIQALYLLFSSYDRKETDQRFRDCWPVYEKKMEGLFRRVALDWMKQIMNVNPTFFRDLRPEALGGLLVNPGGDRFIAALSQFCRFVLYSVANQKKESLKQQVLLPPAPSKDPEIINRQAHVLKVRTIQLAELGLNLRAQAIHLDLIVKRQFEMLENFNNFVFQTGEMYSSRVRSMCSLHPEIFGNPSENEFIQRDAELSNLKLVEVLENNYNDFIKERLEATLQRRTEEIYRPVSFLQDVMEDYSTVWYILEMDKANPVTLECDKILPSQLQGAGEEPSMNAFMSFLVSTTNSMISNPYLNSEPPREILEEFDALDRRSNFLDMLGNRVEELSRLKGVREAVKRSKPRLDVRKSRVANIDWTKLSKVHESDHSKLLDMTPIRVYDINKPSGRTPGINNFLDISLASYSSFEQQSSIVKRRGASISKKRRSHHHSKLTSDNNTPVRNVSEVLHNNSGDNEDMPDSKTPENGNADLSSTLSSSLRSDRSDSHFQQLPVSPIISSMRKSVSFGNTSLDLSRISITNRVSMSSTNSFTPNQSSQHLSESHLEDGGDISSSEADGLDSSARERVHRLLESIVPNHHRRSQSSLGNVDADGDVAIEDGVGISPNSDEIDSHQLASIGKNLKEIDLATGELSGTLSLIDDWEVSKGIMDVSHIELFRNSDSDDDD